MKKILLVTAMAAFSLPSAQAAPKFYGKVFLTADYINAKADMNTRLGVNETTKVLSAYDEDVVELTSHSSRLGVKGSEAMTDNTDVVYQLEYRISVDGDDKSFKSRDTYLGLANKHFGEFRFGRNSSVLGEVDKAIVTEGYWDNLGDSKLKSNNKPRALNMLDDSRQDNSMVWIAPKYKDLPLELRVQYALDESSAADSNDSQDGFGASLMYKAKAGYTLGLAYSKDMDISDDINILDLTDPDEPRRSKVDYGGDVIRAEVTADLDKYMAVPVTLGLLYQQADYDFTGSKKEKGLVVSGEMDLKNFTKPASVYLQYNKTDNLNGYNNSNSEQMVLGGKYKFKKNITAHAYIGKNSADYVAVGKIKGVDVNDKKYERYDNIESDIEVFAFGGGLEYKF
ncbi:porin [Psychrobacter fulvigenes]|uniref:porin n=1 Tax=Psychrobacter fulvigenes TaxID=533323 RepID=UPI00191853F6|nr:porin [Psychrobacter fulvigenes]